MIQCGEPKVQEQKNGNNTRFVRAADEQRETQEHAAAAREKI